MKKNVLALSIAAMVGGLGLAGAASAAVIPGTGAAGGMTTTNATVLQISDAGVGHNLLVPYFNAQNGNMSVFHVVNTDQVNGKAVKVRFRSASNSDDILDFQLFLSPGDVWTGAVTAGSDGVAQITTADNSCTVPALQKNVAQSFVTARLNPSILPADKANQTREGYVEIFNMADIPPNTTGTDAAPTLYQAIKHKNGIAPCSIAGSAARTLLTSAAVKDYVATTANGVTTTAEANAAAAGFNTPTTGLMGDWYIINVPQTTTYSGAATTVAARTALNGPAARGNFVHFPQTNGAAGDVDAFTADPLFRTDSVPADTATTGGGDGAQRTTAVLQAAFYDLPDMSTPYTVTVGANNAPTGTAVSPKDQASLLTQALAVTSVTNQYATDTSITAKTDWVFSMPTRRYSVAANYAAFDAANAATGTSATRGLAAPSYRLFTKLTTSAATGNLQWFRPANTSVDSVGNICVNAQSQIFFDREETTPGAATVEPIFSPGNPTAPGVVNFCGETSVLAFKDNGLSVLGGNVARSTIQTGFYENGWGLINTTNGAGSTASTSGPGLPILGNAFIKLSNPNVGAGVSGTYGITWPHRFTRIQPQ